MTLRHCLDISYARDAAAFKAAIADAANALGFERVSAFLAFDQIAEDTQFILTVANYPTAYLAIAEDRERIKRNPVMQILKRENVPVAWDQAFYRRYGEEDLWVEGAAFGYKAGIGTALHMPNGRHHAFGVSRDEPLPEDAEQLHDLMAQVHLLGCHAHEAASRLFRPVPTCDVALTDRELACLQWTAAGKTAWEVGQIVHLSERTVVAVLSGATKKLDCVNKHQAALRALQRGLIQP